MCCSRSTTGSFRCFWLHSGLRICKKLGAIIAFLANLNRLKVDNLMLNQWVMGCSGTTKEQCLWLHNFKSLEEARMTLKSWFTYYNEQRPHQALGMKTAVEVYKLAA
jgi:hypothetical protein